MVEISERLVVELVAAFLQRIPQPVIALFAPSVNSYVALLRGVCTAFEKPAFFIFQAVWLIESEERHRRLMKLRLRDEWRCRVLQAETRHV